MGNVLMTGGGGGGGSSDDCTAAANDVLKGKTAVYNGSDDEPKAGTLELTGDASDNYVYKGKTYYNTDAHTKRTGTMTVGSILNFSAAAYSGRQVLLKWQNPYAATGKPFGGVFINYSTSGYPGTGGTRIYTGYGNNTASGGWSQAIVTLPNLNTTYYFSCTAYSSCSAGDIWGNTMNASCRTSGNIDKTITWSQNYTVPAGYNYVNIFCVGGGGGGRGGWMDSTGYQLAGGGGGGGYTSTALNVSVSAGQVLNCSVGAGGSVDNSISSQWSRSGTGGTSQVARNGSVLCSAGGGQGGDVASSGGNGGSGGGAPAFKKDVQPGRNGGTNGGNGADGATIAGANQRKGGTGQGRTTRPWGGNAGTIYSGGGGGGGIATVNGYYGIGGNYGGGNGGMYKYGNSVTVTTATAGQANSGGGGGGGHGSYLNGGGTAVGGAGGSGIILLRFH